MASTAILTTLIDRQTPHDGYHTTAIEGFYLTRFSTAEAPRTSLHKAVFCVVAQGAKSVLVNRGRLVYDSGKYLLASLDLPLVGQLEQASRLRPFLGISLVLDFNEIASLSRELPPQPEPAQQPEHAAIAICTMPDPLLDAVTRLTALLTRPAEIAVLAPLIRREIFFRLLISEQGGLLRRMAAASGQLARVAGGLAWLRRNVDRPVRMEQLAREMRMSPSAMHAWFRTVTSMSPLQYQKQLRLEEARRLLLAESLDAAGASRRVGYASASQFSREYRRFFGAPPMQDIARLRSLAGVMT